MVSVLYWIGSLILFFMVPRGRCEPEIMVGHTKVILDNPNYVETHVRDDITSGHLINVCARAHAARVSPKLTETAALPVSYEQCSSEWPPWPNFRAVQSSECSAIGAVWSNASKSEDDNFQSTVTDTVLVTHSFLLPKTQDTRDRE